MLRTIFALITLLLLPLALAGCKTEDDAPVRASAQHVPALAANGTLHDPVFGFSWTQGVGDLDAQSVVLARGVWEEPDGDIVTCTSWDGTYCLATRESDDAQDTLEDLGLIAAGAAVGVLGNRTPKAARPAGTKSTPALAPTRPGATTAVAPPRGVQSTRTPAARATQARQPAATLAPSQATRKSGFGASRTSTKPAATRQATPTRKSAGSTSRATSAARPRATSTTSSTKRR